MDLDKTEKSLSVIVALITIITVICGAVVGVVAYFTPSDRPSTAATKPMPSEKPQPSEKPTTSKESGGSPVEEPLPLGGRVTRLVKIGNYSALAFSILFFPVVLIALFVWPPPETDWANCVAAFGVLGSSFLLLYGVLTLVIGTCAGVMDWPATIALLIVIPCSCLNLILGNIVDQRNVNPDNLAFSQREKHRAQYARRK